MNEIKVNMQNLTNEQQKQLLELIEIANNPRALKLTLGDRYYFINTFNQIEQYIYYNTELDDILLKNGNIFLTLEEAEFEVGKRKVIAELQNYADKYNENKIDWNNFNQVKWKICYDYDRQEFVTDYEFSDREQNTTYFTSGELCVEAVKSIGEDRIKKYLFEVM